MAMTTLFPAWMPPNSVRRWKRAARRLIDTMCCDGTVPVRPFGKENVWHLDPTGLDERSVVLSGGVGKDISTELELIDGYGCHVDLFDPSPTGVATMQRPENHRPQLEFRPEGLAGATGTVRFSEPADPGEGSFTVDRNEANVEFTCRSLSEFARERGYERIDLVKLDVEGFEYEVLDDLLACGLPIRQLCIEFHHFEAHIPWRATASALSKLGRAGYRVIYKDGSDFTLLHRDATD